MRLSGNLSDNSDRQIKSSAIFFSLYYLYVWLVVDPRLIYHDSGVVVDFPVFYRSWEFFQKFISYPGGIVDYSIAFLSQLFCIGWAGAIVIVAQAFSLWLITSSIIKAASDRSYKIICFAFPILLLGYYTRYSYPFGIAMTILVSMFFIRLYLFLVSNNNIVSLLAFLLLSAILYALAGPACLLFVVVCMLYETFFRRRILMAPAFLILAVAVVCLECSILFSFDVFRSFDFFMPRFYMEHRDLLILVYVLNLLLPLLLAYQLFAQSSESTLLSQLDNSITLLTAKYLSSPLIPSITAAIVAVFCHSSVLRDEIAASYYASEEKWGKVLQIASRYPKSKMISHLADRALYNTGLLTQNMFKYGQQPDALMLFNDEGKAATWWRLADSYIQLGCVNVAESMFTQAMDAYGERPLFLKRLALINMAKGNIGAAKVYLNVLSRTLFDANWANEYLKKIESDPNLSSDKKIQQLRSIMPDTDRDFKTRKLNLFQDLLAKNKGNKMAFEYSKAYCLLTHDIDKFIESLTVKQLTEFGYSSIPRVYEDAILFCNMAKKKNFELPGWQVSAESRHRFDDFCDIIRTRYKGDINRAFNDLAKDYGDSYYFYALYGQSGLKK